VRDLLEKEEGTSKSLRLENQKLEEEAAQLKSQNKQV